MWWVAVKLWIQETEGWHSNERVRKENRNTKWYLWQKAGSPRITKAKNSGFIESNQWWKGQWLKRKHYGTDEIAWFES